ncbi:MAG: hypothetical protein KAI26_04815 [Nanoarchaeota archaeon]|nr:hypothetical protein [Nanoarchaeota archaeon]
MEIIDQVKIIIKRMNKAYNNTKTSKSHLKGSDQELLSRINEAKELMQPMNQEDYKKSWNIGISEPEYGKKLEPLNYLIGYLGNARDKLQDELVFKSDNIMKIDIQMRRMRNDLESRKSLLEELVERRDVAREAYRHIKAEKDQITIGNQDQITREDKEYIVILEKYQCLKREKENTDNAVRNNAKLYENTLQNLKLIEISAEQSRISLEDDKIIAACIEDAVEEINAVYHQVVNFMRGKEDGQTFRNG